MNVLKLALAAVSILLMTALLPVQNSQLKKEIRMNQSPAISNVYKVANITGKGSINNTDSLYKVMGTDLGIMWDNGRGQIMLAFGDTYGRGWRGCGTGPNSADWRSNVIALSEDKKPELGLRFSSMIEDTRGHAKEVLSSLKVTGLEETVIPTAGISVDTRHYLHYMSVNHWGQPGRWYTNYAGFAYSDDNGQTWIKSQETRWLNNPAWDSRFQQAALVKSGDFIYMFGTPNGRFGNLYLARVPQNKILNKNNYQYWDGADWQEDEGTAAVILPGPVAEISVQYNSYFNKWLMTYLDEGRGGIVLRDATELTGDWSEPKMLANNREYPQLYGGFIHPWFNDSTDLYFTMSQWCAPDLKYNVALMHATLNL